MTYSHYASPPTLDDALRLKAKHGERARVIAGGTDLLIELARGQRDAPDGGAIGVIDITRIPDLAGIREQNGHIHLGPLVTHNQCATHPLLVAKAFPLARACWEVGAPQIRNRATVAGNIVTASPANDTLTPLLALDACVTVASAARGARKLLLRDFITSFREVDLAPDEILTDVSFRALGEDQRGAFIKLGLRRAQAISVVNVAAVFTRRDDRPDAPLQRAAISLGAVAPVVVRADAAETYLTGRSLSDETIAQAARLASEATAPIDDLRSSAAYRLAMVETLTARTLRQLWTGRERDGWPSDPVTLWGQTSGQWPVTESLFSPGMAGRVNGQTMDLQAGMTLLGSLRAAGLVGVKEGCAEGECGACTVFLDGMAVMACLVPAERAAGSHVITVEGLSGSQQLHPIQAALVQSGGVQCGYCTPGFAMSAAKLLEDRPNPTHAEAQQAIAGNLCRCTGYRKILDAVVAAGNSAQDRALIST